MRLVILLLLLLVGCSNSNLLGNTPQNPEPTESETTEEIAPVNLSNETTQIPIEIKNIYFPDESKLAIYVFEVGGKSSLVLRNEKGILIDSGLETDSQEILKNLRNLGVDELDSIVLTNPTEENVGGMPYTTIQTSPANVFDTGIPTQSSSYQLYRELYPNRTLVSSDRMIILDDVFVRLIVPYDDGKGFLSDIDENSIVAKINYLSNSFLFMSDCGFQCIERLGDVNLDADVLITNGDCDATTLSFLREVSPTNVISTKQMCQETSDRFKFLNIDTILPNEKGDVLIESDGFNYSISTER